MVMPDSATPSTTMRPLVTGSIRFTAKPSPERVNLVTGANQVSITTSDIAIPGGLTPSGGV
jgi:hypothetical protein